VDRIKIEKSYPALLEFGECQNTKSLRVNLGMGITNSLDKKRITQMGRIYNPFPWVPFGDFVIVGDKFLIKIGVFNPEKNLLLRKVGT
jgi:hypothetical protein